MLGSTTFLYAVLHTVFQYHVKLYKFFCVQEKFAVFTENSFSQKFAENGFSRKLP